MRFAPLVGLLLSVSLTSLSAQAPARWTASENLRIGSVSDPATMMSAVGPVAVGPRGNIYVVEILDAIVRVFDSAGKPLPSIGRRGQGPGEFQRIGSIGFLSDTLFVSDGQSRRVSLFTQDGKFLSTLSIVSPPIGGGLGAAVAGRLFPGGTALAAPGVPSAAIADGAIARVPYIRVDRDGRIRDTILWTTLGNGQLAIRRGTGGFYTRQLFADNPLSAFAFDTSGGALVERTAATAAGPAEFRIIRFNLRGDTLFLRRYSYTPNPLPRAFVDSTLRVVAEGLSQGPQAPFPSVAAVEEAFRAVMYIPKFKIPVESMQFSEDGTLWLRRDARDEPVQRWEVYSPRGDLMASLILPARITVRLIQRDVIWAMEPDADGVPFLVRFKITR